MKPEVEYASAAEAEAAFYSAFTRCDLEAMQLLWARDAAVCVHPGAGPIRGYEAVLRSWEGILGGAQPPNVRVNIVQRLGDADLAVHMVEEHVSSPGVPGQEAVVFATNVFRREGRGWLMVAHHASLIAARQSRAGTLQ